jgi:hypothetical protein
MAFICIFEVSDWIYSIGPRSRCPLKRRFGRYGQFRRCRVFQYSSKPSIASGSTDTEVFVSSAAASTRPDAA